MGEEEKVQKELEKLQAEHQELDRKIKELTQKAVFDQILVQRMKRRKLTLKDEISKLQAFLCDDIIA